MKKRKINWGAVGNFVGLLLSVYLILQIVYTIIIEPFFTKEMCMISPLGLLILFLAFLTLNDKLNFFKERLNK